MRSEVSKGAHVLTREEGVTAGDQLSENAAHRPHVHGCGVHLGAEENLWCSVPERHYLHRTPRCVRIGVLLSHPFVVRYLHRTPRCVVAVPRRHIVQLLSVRTHTAAGGSHSRHSWWQRGT